ncbi:MAG TPA: DNA polymerase III subunit delta [Jatrophihabitans sp.]
MPARPVTVDDLPEILPPVLLLVGDEELLISRAISAIASVARRGDPDVTESQISGGEIEGSELHEMLGPSLFSEARLLVVLAMQDVKVAAAPVLQQYLAAPTEGAVIVLQHAGGAKGKALLDAARKAGAPEISVAKLTRPSERLDFVRAEVKRAGGRISPDALTALVDAVGSDLRELAAASSQLVTDSGSGSIDTALVRRFHQGRAEVSGYAVADLAVVGNVPGALEVLRFALDVGVPQVVIADALADGVRSIAKVAGATGGSRASKFDLAQMLGMPPWKVERAQNQLRGWSEPGVREAFGVVARLNADVKGEAADADYALERAILAMAAARETR